MQCLQQAFKTKEAEDDNSHSVSGADQIDSASKDEAEPAHPVISNVVQALEIVRNAANLEQQVHQ